MKIYPAIDLYGGKAVRLYKGDYNEMTVYSDNPADIADDFKKQGAECIHIVDLEGAKCGDTPNIETVKSIVKKTDMFAEVGGGIRSIPVIDKYLEVGVSRVILGTAAVTDPEFLEYALELYGDKIAVGVDIKDGNVAIKGWVEKTELEAFSFLKRLNSIGVKTIICTDISKDGAMLGSNHGLYRKLSKELDMNIIASGGVSSLDDVSRLKALDIHGAIIGKAYYTGAISLAEAIKLTKC